MNRIKKVLVRAAKTEDLNWVRDLAVKAVAYGLPKHRQLDVNEVQQRAQMFLANLEEIYAHSKNLAILVAEDPLDHNLLGYIMMDYQQIDTATGERQALIRDLATAQGQWGNYIAHQLVHAAIVEASLRGLKYVTGEITTDNKRPLEAAINLGFKIERVQVAIEATPEGIM